jgi:serine/threonine protein kinase
MAYAAPEQWRGTPAASLDGRTDLYALGGLLYEMLTGQTPFHAENYEGWSCQHQTTPPQPPSALRPDLANWQGLDALLLRLLAKDRNDRPKDVAELLGLLDAVRLVPSVARRETVREDRAMDATQASAGNRPRPAARWGLRWGITAVSMLLFVALYVFVQSRSKPSNERIQIDPVTGEDIQSAARPPKVYLDPSTGEPIEQHKLPTGNPWDRPATGFIPDDIVATEKDAEALFKQKHYSNARPLFETACNGGEMRACSYLGYLCAKGLGGEHDLQKARVVYQKACDQGILSSCASLGTLYQDAGNNEEAIKNFQKACNGGVVEACELLRGIQ